MRAGRLGAGTAGAAGAAALVACCALGPAALAAGLASALAGVGLGSWLAAAVGLALVGTGGVLIWRRRRRAALCRSPEADSRRAPSARREEAR